MGTLDVIAIGPTDIAFVEIVEKASDISIQNVVHLLLQERVRQSIQRVMLAASRAKAVREAAKVLFVDLAEDGGHGVLDDFVRTNVLSAVDLYVRSTVDTARLIFIDIYSELP